MKLAIVVGMLGALSGVAAADISVLENKKTIAVDCAKDPVVNLVGNRITATLTGTCTRVNVTGNHATVTGSVTNITVSGNNNTLTLDGTDDIAVAGNNNTISYKRALKAKSPSIANSGTDNKIAQAK